LVWRSSKGDNCFPRLRCIRSADTELHKGWHFVSAGPPRQTGFCVWIEVGDFKTADILDQRHPGFVSFSSIGIVARFTQDAQIELIAFLVRGLQTQYYCEFPRRIACK